MATGVIIVISFCARPYVQVARDAGFRVIAIDAFADADTQAMAEQTLVAEYDADGFVTKHVLALFDAIASDAVHGVIYGSGIEHQPQLLHEIAQRYPLLGNTAEVVQVCKSEQFFALLEQLNIAYPSISQQAMMSGGSLMKRLGGSGGTHIRRANGASILPAHHYFQREIKGETYGLLFAADSKRVLAIGIHQQSNIALPQQPMCASRIVSQVQLSDVLQAQILHMAQQLTQALSLRGLNSMDVVVQDGHVYCLEVNPRWSASVDCYRDNVPLMQLHLAGLSGELPSEIPSSRTAHARQIIYAYRAMQIQQQDWPLWVSDIPQQGRHIQRYQPLCTVHAQAEDATQAQALLEQRIQTLSEWLLCQPEIGRTCDSVSTTD